MRGWVWLTLSALIVGGCATTPPPDPNDPAQVGRMRADVIMRNLKWTSDAANMRVERKEITREQAKQIVSDYAREMTDHIDLNKIPQDKAWEYAEVFRTAKMWDKAKTVFLVAIEKPENDDRRVNDRLHLAHVLAELGEVEQAIGHVRAVFDAPPKARAPFMPALTLEIIPAAKGKGHDAELADLLEDALPLFDATVVDPTTKPGKDFLEAKPYHMRAALRLINELRAKG